MKYGIYLVLIVTVAAITQAASPPSNDSIHEMMRVMKLEALLNETLKQMEADMTKGIDQALRKSIEGKELSATQTTAVENFKKKIGSTMREDLSFAKVQDIYTQAYWDSFTQDEVNAVIEFYKSPAGKAIVEKNPIVMKKANDLIQGKIAPLSQKLQAMLETFVKDLARTK